MFTFTTSTETTGASNLFKRTETTFYTETFSGDEDAFCASDHSAYKETSNSIDIFGNSDFYNYSSEYKSFFQEIGVDPYLSSSSERSDERDYKETLSTNGNVLKNVSIFLTINSGENNPEDLVTFDFTFVGTTIIDASGQESEENITVTTGTTTSETFTQLAKSTVSNVATTEGFVDALGVPSVRPTITQITTSSIDGGTMQTVVFGTEEQIRKFYVITERTTQIEDGQLQRNGDVIGVTDINTVYENIYTNYATIETATVVEPRNNILWSVTTTSEGPCHISNIAESFTERTTICPTYITQQLETVYADENIPPEYGILQLNAERIKHDGFEFSNTMESDYANIATGTSYSLPAGVKTTKITTGTTINTVENIAEATTAITAYTTSKNFGFATFVKYPKLFSSTTIEGWVASQTTVSTEFEALEVLTDFYSDAYNGPMERMLFEFVGVFDGAYSESQSTGEEREGQSLHKIFFKNGISSTNFGTNFGWFPEIADKTYFENFGAPNNENYGTNISIQGKTLGFNNTTLIASFAEIVRGLRPTSFSIGNTTYSFGGSISITEGTESTTVPWVIIGNEKTRISTKRYAEIGSYVGQNQQIKNANTVPNVKFMAAYTMSPVANQKPTVFRYPTFYATSNNDDSGTTSYDGGSTYTNSEFIVYNTFDAAFADIANEGEIDGEVTKSYAANYYKIVPESFIP